MAGEKKAILHSLSVQRDPEGAFMVGYDRIRIEADIVFNMDLGPTLHRPTDLEIAKAVGALMGFEAEEVRGHIELRAV